MIAGSFADLLIEGRNDVTIDGIDITDDEVVRLDVDLNGFFTGTGDPELTIAGQSVNDMDEDMNLSTGLHPPDVLDGIGYRRLCRRGGHIMGFPADGSGNGPDHRR